MQNFRPGIQRSKKIFIAFTAIFISTIVSAQVTEKTAVLLLNDSAIKEGHVGVSIYDPVTKTYLYNYNAEKYFTPSSNQKIFTLYAGLKYLPDSILSATIYQTEDYCFVVPNGDPTFLNPEFDYQPLVEILKNTKKRIVVTDNYWQENALGKGWMWDDYTDEFSAERSAMPVFGNVVSISGSKTNAKVVPAFFADMINWNAARENFITDTQTHRDPNLNLFYINSSTVSQHAYPFLTRNGKTNIDILKDVLGKDIEYNSRPITANISPDSTLQVYSYPKEKLFKTMMERSDNFFAEQTLLMVSKAVLGKMNDEAIVNKLLATDLKDIPQKPQWEDGCGLSRYDLCTPQSLVFILEKLQSEFGLDKMKTIFPTGGEGTIKNYYREISGKIFAKTGTMSDNSAFSGYLITKQNKVLIFSVMANNYQKGGRAIRLAIERFLVDVQKGN